MKVLLLESAMVRCAHPTCGCEEALLRDGDRAYCSETCEERSATRPDAACGCGHPECLVGHPVAGPPRRV